jgi:enediyne biosynthesis protein E4
MIPHHQAAALSFVLISLCSSIASSQSFTKITTGPWGTDIAASRNVNWIDYDNDGYLDLFVSNGLEGGQQNFLYHNNHDGTFTKITSGPLVNGHAPSDGSSWADYDNDGDLDAVVVAWYDSANAFFENNANGTFTQILAGPVVNDRGYSETCSWGDYDNDGYVDLYVSNSGGPSVGGPKVNFLYHNNHDRTFTRITAGEIVTDAFYSRGSSWVDYDNDGDVDVFVANERGQHENLYRNMLKESGVPTFSKITTGQIVNDGGNTMSASWGDADNDGDLDVYLTNGWPAGSLNSFFLNNGDRTFTKVLNDTTVRSTGYHMGSAWGDFDNDGDLDLFVTTAYSPSATKNELFMNMLIETGTLSFQRIGTGDVANDVGWSYGCAWGDYDRDGDLDLFVAKTFNENEHNVLYRNDNSNGNRWLEVRCVGTTSNRSGIGAKIWIKATIGGHQVWQLREVDGQSGYCGQNLDQHIGLGNATVIDSMKIEWPNGQIDVYNNVSVDRIVVANEGTGLTGVDDEHGSIPANFELLQNYPNPFNPTTMIGFRLQTSGLTTLKVYNVLGQEMRTLVHAWLNSGEHEIAFDASGLSSGVYCYSLQSSTGNEVRRMMLLR